MRGKQINELQGTSILTKTFFNKLIRRIECTKPTAGSNITISEEENGFKISSDFTTVTLNVCSNGTPDTLVVLTPKN